MELLGSIRDLTVKFPTPGGKSCVKSPGKSPMQPSRGGWGNILIGALQTTLRLLYLVACMPTRLASCKMSLALTLMQLA